MHTARTSCSLGCEIANIANAIGLRVSTKIGFNATIIVDTGLESVESFGRLASGIAITVNSTNIRSLFIGNTAFSHIALLNVSHKVIPVVSTLFDVIELLQREGNVKTGVYKS